MKREERNNNQLVFQFVLDYEQKEKEDFREYCKTLPFYANPSCDNEFLFNCQYEYYNQDKAQLDQMFFRLLKIAEKLVAKECGVHKLKVTKQAKKEFALDATVLVIEQYEKNNLIIKESFIAYLRLQVLKVLFGQTEADRLEKYCVNKGINLFTLSELEKQKVKEDFESGL